MPVKLLYFAWVREKIGRAEEVVDLPAGIGTVADLVAWLRQRGAEYEAAFARPGVVRAAIDKRHVQLDGDRRRPGDRPVPAGHGGLSP